MTLHDTNQRPAGGQRHICLIRPCRAGARNTEGFSIHRPSEGKLPIGHLSHCTQSITVFFEIPDSPESVFLPN